MPGLLVAAWVASWTASSQEAEQPSQLPPHTLIRETVRVSVGGTAVRLHLSNQFGKAALHVGRARIAGHTARFGGKFGVKIAPGREAVTDALVMNLEPLSIVTIEVELPEGGAASTVHELGGLSKPRQFVIALDAQSDAPGIVALGDSLTDGYGSTNDANRRWTDFFATFSGGSFGVANAGISGNRVLEEPERLEHDVLQSAGARFVVFFEGANDLAEHTSAEEVSAEIEKIVGRVHAAGLKIFGGTLPPCEGSVKPLAWSPQLEVQRAKLNEWIRANKGGYDGVIDFDKALADPAHPARLAPKFDSGDHAHPNDAGYEAMARAVDPALFR